MLSENDFDRVWKLHAAAVRGTVQKFVNHFQSRNAIWHHTFNSVLHMLQFWGAGEG
jgi:hypothetical protein